MHHQRNRRRLPFLAGITLALVAAGLVTTQALAAPGDEQDGCAENAADCGGVPILIPAYGRTFSTIIPALPGEEARAEYERMLPPGFEPSPDPALLVTFTDVHAGTELPIVDDLPPILAEQVTGTPYGPAWKEAGLLLRALYTDAEGVTVDGWYDVSFATDGFLGYAGRPSYPKYYADVTFEADDGTLPNRVVSPVNGVVPPTNVWHSAASVAGPTTDGASVPVQTGTFTPDPDAVMDPRFADVKATFRLSPDAEGFGGTHQGPDVLRQELVNQGPVPLGFLAGRDLGALDVPGVTDVLAAHPGQVHVTIDPRLSRVDEQSPDPMPDEVWDPHVDIAKIFDLDFTGPGIYSEGQLLLHALEDRVVGRGGCASTTPTSCRSPIQFGEAPDPGPDPDPDPAPDPDDCESATESSKKSKDDKKPKKKADATEVDPCEPTTGSGGIPAGCSTVASEGGEWRSYGHDVANTRSQPLETTIGVDNAGELGEAYRIDLADEGIDGVFQNTPVVADGCLYGATTGGSVFAANADTGEMLWTVDLRDADATYQVDGVIVGSVAVEHGLVYAVVNQNGTPHVTALDQTSGAQVWRTYVSDPLDDDTYSYGSPVVSGDTLVFGMLSNAGSPSYRGKIAIVDAVDGTLLHFTPVIPDAEFCQDPKCNVGFAGGSVWTTGAIDEVGRYAYFGTGNPSASGPQHPNTNAILKVDIDRDRPSFGQIVGVAAGTDDTIVAPGADENPVCRNVAPELTYPANSPVCLHFDLDFGASPNLFTDADGRLLVGDLQKSGTYHAADAGSMDNVWAAQVGAPCFPCNGASTAFDGERILGIGAPPGQAFALDTTTGSHRWITPLLDGLHYEAMSTANGVSYTYDGRSVHAYDNSTGTEVATIQVTDAASFGVGEGSGAGGDQGVASLFSYGSSGIAIARNSLYVPADDALVVLRRGAEGPGEPPASEPRPPTPGFVTGVGCEAVSLPATEGSCEFTTDNPGGSAATGYVSKTPGTFRIENVTPGCAIRLNEGLHFTGRDVTRSADGQQYTFTGFAAGASTLGLDDRCTYRLTVLADLGPGAVYAGQLN